MTFHTRREGIDRQIQGISGGELSFARGRRQAWGSEERIRGAGAGSSGGLTFNKRKREGLGGGTKIKTPIKKRRKKS